MKCSLGISNFLEEISSLSHSVVFLYFFALIAEEGFLISSCYSLELCIQMFISFLFCFSLLFFSQLFVRPSQTAILLFCISFPWGWSWSLSPVQCHEPHSIVHQAVEMLVSPELATSSGCFFHYSAGPAVFTHRTATQAEGREGWLLLRDGCVDGLCWFVMVCNQSCYRYSSHSHIPWSLLDTKM